ncbi:MAG: hypothetical protein ABI333_23200, partial [bacterium]
MRGLIGALVGLLVLAWPVGELEARPGKQRIRKQSQGKRGKQGKRARGCRKRRGDQLVALKYLQGGAVWIPSEARCGGSFPVVVLLHGNNTDKEKVKSLGGGRNLDRWARRYLNGKLIRPVILAEPIHFGACASAERRHGLPYLFSGRFDFTRYRKLLEATLRRRGIRAQSWSFIGHSGAACCLHMGMFGLEKAWPEIRVWASADGCYSNTLQAATLVRQFEKRRTKVINSCRGYPSYKGYKQYEHALLSPDAKAVRCDKRYYKRCRRHPTQPWFSYVTQFSGGEKHSQVLVELFKTVVFHEFPSAKRIAYKKQLAARRKRIAARRAARRHAARRHAARRH